MSTDIDIIKYYEKLRTLQLQLKYLQSRVSELSSVGTTTNQNTLDNNRMNSHIGDGSIHFTKGGILVDDLGDTTIADSPADKELLSYDLTNLDWINRTQKEAIPELEFFNGTFIEKFGAVITSAGGVITLTLTEVNAGNLTMLFSDGYTELDVTPGATIVLTAGASDAAPQANYIYILQSGKVLAKSTTGWPATEHIKVGYFLVPTAVFVAANNVYVNQNWNDGTDATQGQGHMSHVTQRSRYFGARYFSGVDPAGGDDYLTIGIGTTDFKSGAGVVWQMHSHTFGAFDTSGGDLVLVKNWNGDAYHDITDLFDIVDDSAGVALANKWFTLVVWGVCNQSGELDYIMINLPSGSYTTEAKATEDASSYTDFSIPRAFSLDSSTGFLIAAIVVKQAATWLYGSTKDLRGITSAFAVAGATGTGITDHASLTSIGTNTHTQIDTHITGADAAAVAAVEAAGLALAATKVITSADADLTFTFGRASTFSPFADFAAFAQRDMGNTTFALMQKNDGTAYLNTATGKTIYFRVQNATVMEMTVSTFKIFTNGVPGIVTLGGDNADDASLVLPYLTAAPATLTNGAIWMEADGLHIYYAGAEKIVAGV